MGCLEDASDDVRAHNIAAVEFQRDKARFGVTLQRRQTFDDRQRLLLAEDGGTRCEMSRQ